MYVLAQSHCADCPTVNILPECELPLSRRKSSEPPAAAGYLQGSLETRWATTPFVDGPLASPFGLMSAHSPALSLPVQTPFCGDPQPLSARLAAPSPLPSPPVARGPHVPRPLAEHKHEAKSGHRHVPTKPLKLIDTVLIGKSIRAGCCDLGCLKSWTVADILTFRRTFAEQNEQERLDSLISLVQHLTVKANGHIEYCLSVITEDQTRVFALCRQAFVVIVGTSSHKLYRAVHLSRLHLVAPIHSNLGQRQRPVAEAIQSWLDTFVVENCDKISDAITLLPSSLSWKEIHAFFVKEQHSLGSVTASYAEFCAVRRGKFAHVKPPHTGTLATCDVCDQLHHLAECAHTQEQRDAVHAKKLQHKEIFCRERVFMQDNMRHSASHPDDQVMLFVDYSSPIKLPHFQRVPSVRSLEMLSP
jgi:hypothetical protein